MKILKQMTKFLALLAALMVCQGTAVSGACSRLFNKHLADYESELGREKVTGYLF